MQKWCSTSTARGGQLDAEGKPRVLRLVRRRKNLCRFRDDGHLHLAVTARPPYDPNAITQMSAALVRIGQYKFKPELSDLTRAYFKAAARSTRHRRLLQLCGRSRPIRLTRRRLQLCARIPATVGKIGTTCVATMIKGGHALNALPQSVTADINCRIFPGHPPPRSWRSCSAPPPIPQSNSRISRKAVLQPMHRRCALIWSKRSPRPFTSAIRAWRCFPRCQPERATACGSEGAHSQLWRESDLHEGQRSVQPRPERARAGGDITPCISYMLSLFSDLAQ